MKAFGKLLALLASGLCWLAMAVFSVWSWWHGLWDNPLSHGPGYYAPEIAVLGLLYCGAKFFSGLASDSGSEEPPEQTDT